MAFLYCVSVMNNTYIVYGTQTGTTEDLAEELYDGLKEVGYEATFENIFELKAAQMKEWKRLFVVISTWGDGEPPEDALEFYNDMVAMPDGALSDLEFGVLALGDSGYDQFCQCGIDFDTHLERLGATRIIKRVDCDIDYEEPSEAWIQELIGTLTQVPA